jgi:AhpD family alkylhydroperoxidase
MKENITETFSEKRDRQNKLIMKYAGINTKRIFSVDSKSYDDGALPAKTKELIGLIASFVLRCDDCVTYHLIQCKKNKVTDEELEEALEIGLLIGGSITIPHLRRAYEAWENIKEN